MYFGGNGNLQEMMGLMAQFQQRQTGRSRFDEQYHCYSMAMSGKGHLEDGDKILLPPSALDTLARMNVDYPMLFELSSPSSGKRTHSGVLEFSAEEGRVYIPFWMMSNLLIEEGALISVKNVSLPKATFVKFRAQSVDFLEISNPRAVLEVTLRKFTCVTVGDQIKISHAGKNYFLELVEVQPNGAASIIETDCNVDFDEPVGYRESKYAAHEREREAAAKSSAAMGSSGGFGEGAAIGGAMGSTMPVREVQKAKQESTDGTSSDGGKGSNFNAFSGAAKRIDGKSITSSSSPADSSSSSTSSSFSASSSSTSRSATSNSSGSSSAPSSVFNGRALGGAASNGESAPQRQSLIGNKFSTKKTAVSAFSGAGNKLR